MASRSMSAIRTSSSSSTIRPRIDLDHRGPEIENDPAFPERINVHVAAVRDDGIHMRSWERGAGPDAGLRHRRLRDRGRGNRDQARREPGQGAHARRHADDQLGAGEPVRMRGGATHVFKAISTSTASGNARRDGRDGHAWLPTQFRRERDHRRAPEGRGLGGRQQLRGDQRGGPPDPPGDPPSAPRHPDARILVTGCAAELDRSSSSGCPR
jgi:hypothetical protein